MKNLFLLIIVATVISACSNYVPDEAHTRAIFNARNLKVITSFANRKQQTISVLYGNDAAKTCALSGYKTHVAGELFKLVVFRQADNKYWYGSYINGKLLSEETVTSEPSQFVYRLKQGSAPDDSVGHQMSDEARTASILSHKPSVFP
jgi:hypothetical protein